MWSRQVFIAWGMCDCLVLQWQSAERPRTVTADLYEARRSVLMLGIQDPGGIELSTVYLYQHFFTAYA